MISINGEQRDWQAGGTVASLLGELKLDAAKIAIELNRIIIPRSHYGATPLAAGDAIEIVRFIGGG